MVEDDKAERKFASKGFFWGLGFRVLKIGGLHVY